MTDHQELEILKQQKPDLVAAMRALFREEMMRWAIGRRDAMMQEIRFIEKEILALPRPTRPPEIRPEEHSHYFKTR